MALVTATEVKAIMDNCIVDDLVVDTFIIAAHETIIKVFTDSTGITTTLLKEIERWFTAHMVASVLDRTTAEEKIGDLDIKYAAKYGANLSSTPYGQMVMQLDVTGKMSNIGKMGASIYAVKSFDDGN